MLSNRHQKTGCFGMAGGDWGGWELTEKEHQGTFWGYGNVLNLDRGDGYICQNLLNYIHQHLCIL